MIRNQEIYGRQWVEIYAEETLLWKDIANKKNLRENPGSDMPDGWKEGKIRWTNKRNIYWKNVVYFTSSSLPLLYSERFPNRHSCPGFKKRMILFIN